MAFLSLATNRLGLGVGLLLGVRCWQREANTKAQMTRSQVGTAIGVQAGMSLSLERGLALEEETTKLRSEISTWTASPEH